MGSRSRKRGKAAPAPPARPAARDAAEAAAAAARGKAVREGARAEVAAAASAPSGAPPATGAGRVPGPLDEFSAVAAPAPPAADAAAATDAAVPADAAGGRPKRLRGEAANEAIRAQLQPLAPGERPPALRAAIVLAILLGLANLVLALANVEVEDGQSSRGGAIVFAGVMFAAAWGMWDIRYWAILGFQTLLAITVVIASLAILVSSNVLALLLCLTVVGSFGVLFWKLVRVLSRVQMPDRSGA